MITISLCMIVKNEEAVLARCLDSVAPAMDEIIIVDTGSTDKTKEIAARYTSIVPDFAWIDDFSAARNFAYSHATMDYQMWLDADDVFPPEELQKLLSLKKILNPEIDMVTMKYHTHFNPSGVPVLTSTRERLTKRSKNYQWIDPVHECIPLSGNIYNSNIAVHHKKPPSNEVSMRNLRIYENKEKQGTPFSPRQLYYFARELKDHRQYAKSSYYFERFLDTQEGWVEDNISACFCLSTCYRILKNPQKRLSILTKSFQYAPPRAELCCELGYYYKDQGAWQTALDWFSLALKLDQPNIMGFVLRDYWGYIPAIESAYCCSMLGQIHKAADYNALAGKYRPNDPAVKQNQQYFAQLTEKENNT